jgi:CrcB protein
MAFYPCTIARHEHELPQVPMNQLVVIAVGGSLGALLRFWVANGVAAWLGKDFPYGTLLINITGSLAIGFLYVLFVERFDVNALWRPFLIIGFLGAYTTFSSFSLETLLLIEAGEPLRAFLNVLLSVSLCLAATTVGLLLGRQL